MPAADPNTRSHLEWLGYIQPHGLVVSPPALLKAGAFVNRQDAHRQALLAGRTEERALAPGNPQPCIRDFREFAGTVAAGTCRPHRQRRRCEGAARGADGERPARRWTGCWSGCAPRTAASAPLER